MNQIERLRDFGKKLQKDIHNLFDLQLILLNIWASSAFIERFFSVSGIICDIKRANMEEDLIRMRSMLILIKANMPILNSTNEFSLTK